MSVSALALDLGGSESLLRSALQRIMLEALPTSRTEVEDISSSAVTVEANTGSGGAYASLTAQFNAGYFVCVVPSGATKLRITAAAHSSTSGRLMAYTEDGETLPGLVVTVSGPVDTDAVCTVAYLVSGAKPQVERLQVGSEGQVVPWVHHLVGAAVVVDNLSEGQSVIISGSLVRPEAIPRDALAAGIERQGAAMFNGDRLGRDGFIAAADVGGMAVGTAAAISEVATVASDAVGERLVGHLQRVGILSPKHAADISGGLKAGRESRADAFAAAAVKVADDAGDAVATVTRKGKVMVKEGRGLLRSALKGGGIVPPSHVKGKGPQGSDDGEEEPLTNAAAMRWGRKLKAAGVMAIKRAPKSRG
jgi:hypothetical protein